MANLIALLLGPILLLCSIPLAIFAAFTSALAFSTLIVHVLIIYAELAAVLMRNQFSNAAVSPSITHDSLGEIRSHSPTNINVESYCKSGSGTTGHSNSNAGSMTPKVPESSGLGIFGSGGVERDFEGVGGWRVPGSDDDDVLWTSMNSRLELPAILDDRKRHHQRSLTSGSITSTPLITRSSMRSLKKNLPGAHAGDDLGSTGYFDSRANSKSVTAVDSTSMRRSSLCRKNSSASMFSSDGSTRTLQTKSPLI